LSSCESSPFASFHLPQKSTRIRTGLHQGNHINWLGFIRVIRSIYGQEGPDLDLIEREGLLAVKIGQTYALRVDFLPEATCLKLTRLYRHVTAIPSVDFRDLMKRRAPARLLEELETLDDKPLASASVGQVHTARLRGGERVVVKIVKSDHSERFIADVRSLRKFIRLVLMVYPKLERVADPLGILETIERGTLDELDLRREMAGQRVLTELKAKYSAAFDLGGMQFPKIYPEFSNDSVLVSEYVGGQTVDELLERRQMSYDALLELFRLHGFFMFCVGTFHGDIHPGNLIRRDNGFFFLDTGVIGRVGDTMRRGLLAFFQALSAFDHPACAKALNAMAERGIEGEQFREFETKFVELYSDFANRTVAQVSLTRKMMETIRLGVNHGMVFEKGMYPIIKSLMYMDGMVLRCNPEAVLMKDMRPFLAEFERGMGTQAQ
jgi:ubiquinone biosynthesis protein